ncbi:MAG: serine hydrolase domain-containing protein [Planctomycetota bacterium]
MAPGDPTQAPAADPAPPRLRPRWRRAALALAGALLVLGVPCIGCRARAEFRDPLPPDGAFRRVEPSGAQDARFSAAAAYSAETDGLALLVLEGDKLLFERYQNGNTAEVPHHLFSGTKSFSGVLVAAAVEDGLLSLDERVVDTLPELRGDARKEQVTVRHLLDFTSGWEDAFWRTTWDGLHQDQRVADKYAYTLGLAVERDPGTRYRYGGSHQMVLGRFLQRKLGEDPVAWLERRVTGRLGMRFAGWIRDPQGNPMLPYGAWTTAYEWAKLGVFLLQRGKWRGEQVVAWERLQECLQGSAAMPAYGLTFWLNRPVPDELRRDLIPQLREPASRGAPLLPGGPEDLFAAAGHDGNRCYVIPSKNLVIVRMGTSERPYRDERLLRLVLGMDE